MISPTGAMFPMRSTLWLGEIGGLLSFNEFMA